MAEVDRRDGGLSVAPLSRSQASALFSCKLAGNTALLHLPAAVRIQGPLDADALRYAIDAIVARHEILRTVFVEVEGKTVQRALPPRPFALERIRVSEGSAETKLSRAIQLAEVNATIPLDLETHGPLRALLFDLDEHDHVLLLVVHHVAWDGWSIGLFVRELQLFYEAKLRGALPSLAPLLLQYSDVAKEEARALAAGALEPLLTAAENELRDLGRARLPLDRPRGMTSRFSGDMVFVNLPMPTGQGVVALARRLGATPFMLLSAAFSAVLQRYAGFDPACEHARFALGTPLANRGRPEVAALIGYFAQVVPIVHDLSQNPTFEQHVEAVRLHTLAAQRRETLPFDVLVERLGGARTADQNPIFDAMFALHAESLDRMTLSGMSLSPIDLKSQVNHFDLGLHLWPRDHSFAGYFSFATGLFDAATIARLASHYTTLLTAAVAAPNTPVSDLPLLCQEEQAWLQARSLDALSRTDLLPRLRQGLPADFVLESQAPSLRDNRGQGLPIAVEGRVFLGETPSLDLGVWRASGELCLTGCVPGYAFVRGERVALAPIEAALRCEKAVAYAEVLPRPTAQGTELTAAVTLRRRLPRQVLEQRAPGAHLLLLDRIPVGPLPLDTLPVLDSALLSGAEQQVATLPGLRGARAFLSPNVQAPPQLHASDLLSGYTRSGKVDLATTTEQADAAADASNDRPLAYTSGGPLALPDDAPQTLVEALRRVAVSHPERGITLIEEDGSEAFLSYKSLLERAQRVAAGLGQAGFARGRYAVLQVPSLSAHFVAFWGCALAGIVPVTVALAPSYSEPSAILTKLWGIASLLDEPVVIGDRHSRDLLAGVPGVLGHAQKLHAVAIENLEEAGINAPFVPVAPRPEDVLFLQLTSGSTGIPKCIQETHRAVIHHIHGARLHNDYRDSDVDLSFLPFDHVVPTLTCHLKDVYLGVCQIHVRTSHVLYDPLRWLALLEKYQVTHTWAPNFGFKLVADALVAQPERRFDLSSVRLFMNAGEQVTLPVVREFLRLTLPFGVSPRAMQPAFGMAEAATCMTWENNFELTTGVLRVAKASLGRGLQPALPEEEGIDFVGLGPTMPGVEVRIAGEHNETLPELTIGRLEIRGAVVTPGYLKNDEANREAFPGDNWLDSGDLGFLSQGRLFVTGRKKEMIVVRGANLYCYEIEDVVGRLPGVLPTFVAACAVEDRGAGTESVAVFFVPKADDRGKDGPVDGALLRSIRAAVGRELGVTPTFVLPLTRATFPKTTSGKIQRMALKKGLARGDFDELVRRTDFLLDNEHVLGGWFFRWLWRPSNRRPRAPAPLLSCLVVGQGPEAEALARRLEAPYHPASTALPPAPTEVLIHARGLDAPCDGALPNLEGCLAPGLRRLLVVTRGALATHPAEAPSPERAAWQGLLASLAEEQEATTRLIDVAPDGPLSSGDLDALAAELHLPDDELVVALRGARRLVRRLQYAAPQAPVSPPIVRAGFYLVTGGLGGVGSALAERLLRDFGATLLLTGRSAREGDLSAQSAGLAPARSLTERARTLARLSALGPVLFEEADVSDMAAMTQVIQRAEASVGRRLDGVFHLAGVFPTRLVSEETPQTLAATCQPKLVGAQVLSELFPEDRLFVALSSVYGAFGAAASGAYAAASSALDALVAARRQRGLVRSFSLACSLVRDLGMSRGFAFEESAAALGYHLLDAERAITSIFVALAEPSGQLLIGLDPSKENIRRVLDGPAQSAESMVVFCQGAPPSGAEFRDAFGVPFRPRLVEVSDLPSSAAGGADLATAKQGPRTPTQRVIAEIWSELLKVANVDVDTSFFALGGQSILLVQALGRLNQRLHQNLVVVDLFRYPTIRALADLIDRKAPLDVDPRAEKAEARAEKQREAARARAALRGRGSK